MRKIAATLAATGALLYGAAACAGPEAEPQASQDFTLSQLPNDMDSLLNDLGPQADQMWADGMAEFAEKTENGGADVRYYEEDCASFDAEEGSILVRNPGFFKFGNQDVTIEFMLYAQKAPEAGETIIYNGPYTYSHPALHDVPLMNNEVAYMNPGGELTDITVTHSGSSEKTAWIEAEDGTRISETIIVPYVDDEGTPNYDALVAASEELCGRPLDVEATTGEYN